MALADPLHLVILTEDGGAAYSGHIEATLSRRTALQEHGAGMILQVLAGAVAVEDDLLIALVGGQGILTACHDGQVCILLIFADGLQCLHVQCQQCLTAGAGTGAADIVLGPAVGDIFNVGDPHLLAALLDIIAHQRNVLHVGGAETGLFGGAEVIHHVRINAHQLAGYAVHRHGIVGTHDAIYLQRYGGVGGIAAGGVHHIHDVDVGADSVPHIHHGHGEILLVHEDVHLVLHHALDVLQGAGEDHAGMGLQNGQVDNVLGLYKEAGQHHMVDIGAIAANGDLDKILVPLDVDELHALFTGHIGDTGDLVALQRIAADGGGLGDDDALGVGLLHLADDGAHRFGMGADCQLGRCGMACIGLEHHGGVGLDHVGNAAHHIKYAADIRLYIFAVGKRHEGLVLHSRSFSFR